MNSRSIAFLVASMLFTACAAPVESAIDAENIGVAPQSTGDGICEPNQTRCFVWDGMEQIAGQCVYLGTPGYMCCTGCIDSRGVCQAGTDNNVCGNGGNACSECANDLTCKPKGVCCPPVTIDPDSGLPVGKDCGV